MTREQRINLINTRGQEIIEIRHDNWKLVIDSVTDHNGVTTRYSSSPNMQKEAKAVVDAIWNEWMDSLDPIIVKGALR